MYDLERIRKVLIEEGKSKQCKRCKKLLPATTEYFHKNKFRKDGLTIYCKKCRNNYVKQYRHITKRRTEKTINKKSRINRGLIAYFLNKYCEYGDYIIRYEFLYNCINHFCTFFNNNSLSKCGFTHFLKENDNISLHVPNPLSGRKGIRRNAKKIIGIRLNTKGIKRFGVQNVANLDIKKTNTISHKNACVLMSCHPGQCKLKEIYERLEEDIKAEIDYDKVIEFYKRIETYLFRKNIYRSWKVKIPVAMYLGSTLSQKVCADTTGCTSVSLRSLLKLVTSNIELIYKKKGW